MRVTALLLLMTLLVVPANAIAQEVTDSFALLNQQQILRAGNSLRVVYSEERGGATVAREINVTFLNLTDSAITVLADRTELVIEEKDVRRIVREQRGPLWNGALIGAAVGGGACLLLFWGFPDDRSDLIPFCGAWAGVGAGTGVGVDALRKEHSTVYLDRGLIEGTLRLEAVPLLSKNRKGLLFSVTW